MLQCTALWIELHLIKFTKSAYVWYFSEMFWKENPFNSCKCYSLSRKTVNTREISGMFVSRSFRCQMKPQKITNKPQQGSVTTWYEKTSWPFCLREIFNFPFVSLWKSYFLTPTNTGHLILSVQKPNYRTDLKVSANCENLQQYRFASRVKVSQLQKIWIENH